MELYRLVKFSEELGSVSSIIEKVQRIKDLMKDCKKEEIPIVASIISGEKIGSIFIGYSTISWVLEKVSGEGEGIQVVEVFEFMKRAKKFTRGEQRGKIP